MSDSDEENFVFFGTPLEPLEEEEITRKKPVSIADQIVVDENGRRRFHGAFTGGFSAGYYNTVGSKEGWAPSTFKSTRNDRTSVKSQNVHDFMDDEDVGVFGIAPQMLRPTDDYTTTRQGKKRPKPAHSDGPIPGVPVLEKIIEPVKSTIGVRLLQKLGWRPGQGIGPRITQSEKRKAKKKKQVKQAKTPEAEPENKSPESTPPATERSYGCLLPPELKKHIDDDSSSSESYEEVDRDALFAPDDYDAPFYQPKVNTFGLGYKGLDRDALVSSGHVDLFGSQLKFKVDNKKMNITGEAFGVGAFEEADADIYSHEDMSQYDFALETPQERKQRKTKESIDKANKKKLNSSRDSSIIEGFCRAKAPPTQPKFFKPPDLPADFQAMHISRKSRFEKKQEDEANKKRVFRHGLTIAERQVLIGEHSNSANEKAYEKSHASTKDDDTAGASSSFSSRDSNQSASSNQKSNDAQKMSSRSSPPPKAPDASILERIERLKKFTQVLQAYSSSKAGNEMDAKGIAFKPFMKNPEKQERYEKYLTLVAAGFQECLKDLQPIDMTDWEKEREKLEFQRAAALYKPIAGVMSSRFVSAKSHDISHLVPEREIEKEKDPTQDPIVAAKMNLFGKLTHRVVEWHPDKILSRRFNVPPPYPDSNIVGLRAGTSVAPNAGESKEIPKPAPVAKKSLFADLDFSKPPPGLFPVQTQSSESSTTKSLEFSAEPNKSNKSLGIAQEIEQEKGTESPIRLEAITSKPSMDLFKEIFADTSSESEEEFESSSKTQSSKVSTFASASTKQVPIKMSHERTENRDKPEVSEMRRDDGETSEKQLYNTNESTRSSKDRSKERSDSEETRSTAKPAAQNKDNSTSALASNKKGIFDNLDFTQLGTGSKAGVHKGHHETKSQLLASTSSSKDGNDSELIEDDGLLYGPLPPPWLATSGPPKTSLIPYSSSKTISSTNYSYSQNKQDKRENAVADEDQGMWVEKESVKSRSSSHSKKKHKKKSSKSHKTSSSSLSKKSKGKHKSKDKHKSKKDHKRKSKRKTSKKDKRRNETSSSSDDESGEESTSSSSSVEIHDSLDNRALLNKLKEITRSH